MEAFVVPSQVIWTYPEEAARLARLGALANAVVSVSSMSAGSLAIGVGKERDQLQSILMLVGYLKEAVEVFNNGNNRGVILEGVAAGYRLPKPFDELWAPFTKGRLTFYESLAIAIRNTKAFHINEDAFVSWASGLQAPSVTLWRKDSPAPVDWVFTASARIQAFTGPHFDQDAVSALHNGAMMSFLVEAMAWGLVARAGLDPHECYTRMGLREMTIDYTFSDGREALTESVPMITDESGGLDSFVGALREHTTRVFGGATTGVGLLTSGDIVVRSVRGKAKVTLGAALPPRPTGDPATVMARMRDMASWGQHGVTQAMEYADRVRTGQVTPEDTKRFIDALRADLEFWDQRKRDVDQLLERLRDAKNQGE